MKALKIVAISLAGASIALSVASSVLCLVDIRNTKKKATYL